MKHFITFFLLLFLSSSAFSLDAMRVIGVQQAVYHLQAPPPFGQLKITFDSNAEGDTEAIWIDSDAGRVKIAEKITQGVTLIGVPEVSYSYSSFKKIGAVKELRVFFEYGEYVELYKGEEYQKRILGFSISNEKKVEVLQLDK